MQQFVSRALEVAVLAGGQSHERNISLASGQAVCRALTAAGHLPTPFDPAETSLGAIAWARFDACFIALHGGAGEDGSVQRRLESLGVPYTGSDPAASQLAMNKSASKLRFFEREVPTCPWLLLAGNVPALETPTKVGKLGFPLVVKPDSQGSSLGVTLVNRPTEMPPAVAKARQFGQRVIVEQFVEGREFTVAVLGRRPLPTLEVRSPEPLFSYDAKYRSKVEHSFDTGLSNKVQRRLVNAAVDAAEALGTSGLVRVDLMLDTAGYPWVLEVNTVPGLTARSLAPMAALRAGIEFPELCDWMLRDALAQHRAQLTLAA